MRESGNKAREKNDRVGRAMEYKSSPPFRNGFACEREREEVIRLLARASLIDLYKKLAPIPMEIKKDTSNRRKMVKKYVIARRREGGFGHRKCIRRTLLLTLGFNVWVKSRTRFAFDAKTNPRIVSIFSVEACLLVTTIRTAGLSLSIFSISLLLIEYVISTLCERDLGVDAFFGNFSKKKTLLYIDNCEGTDALAKVSILYVFRRCAKAEISGVSFVYTNNTFSFSIISS